MLIRGAPVQSTLDDAADVEWSLRDQPASGESIGAMRDARSFWTILRWRARLIAAVTAGTIAAVAAACIILPPRYKATTIVLVDPRQPRVTNTEVITGIGSDAAAVESQVELIESSSLARKVIARLKLDDDVEFTSPSTLEQIMAMLPMSGQAADERTDTRVSRIVSRFQRGLSVRRRGLTYILEITYASADPAKAARISGAVADAYVDDQRQAKADVTARASGWLGGRIEELRERVRVSDEAVAAYKAGHNIVDVTQGNRLISRQIEDLTQQLALARSRTAEADARLERAQQVAKHVDDPAALSESLQSTVIANLRSQYTEAARIEAEYNALYGSRYPGLVAVRAQLADIRRQIDGEIARIVAAIRAEHQVALARAASLEAELAKLKEQSSALNETNVKLQELEREAQANRALFEQFLSRAKETAEQQNLQMADARIVSPALVPLKPDRPATPLLLIAAAGFGLAFAIGLVLMLERMRRSFRTGSEVEKWLALPSLGMVPHRPRRIRAERRPRPASPANGMLALPARRYEMSDVAACFEGNLQAIRARLRHAAARKGNEVLVVVSALQGEGKSTFASNLALACASSGAKTLLIDGDLYTRSVTRAFGISGPGLADVVRGEVALWQAVKKERKSGLHVIGAGEQAQSRAAIEEIAASDLDGLLDSCRSQFDLVVVDSPAILPMAGLVPFVDRADRAVLIVEWDGTDRETVAEALQALGPDAGKIAGVVLNKVAMDWYRLFAGSRYVGYFDDPLEVESASRIPA